jgi:hypothetical protein
VPGDMPKVSSPVSTTTVPAEQVNGFHDNVVQGTPAPAAAHAEPNGFDEFDPRGSVPGIVLSFLSNIHYTHGYVLMFSFVVLLCIVFQILPLQ